MKNVYRIAALIQRYLSGEAMEDEFREVEEWKKESAQHEEMMYEFQHCDWEKKKVSEYDIFDKEEAYQDFLVAKRRLEGRRSFRRRASVAAGILLLLGSGIYYLLKVHLPEKELSLAGAAIENTGSNRAVLTLGCGDRVLLNDSTRVVLMNGAVKIEEEGTEVSYANGEAMSAGVSVNILTTPRGGEYNIRLEDGTLVWLNADSRLRFPSRFPGDERVVHVEGEAFFKVAKDSLRPFLIHTNRSMVRVLGTSFNVRTYPDETDQTTLVEGRVAVYCDGKVMNMLPNEQWTWTENGGEVKPTDVRFALGWREGCFSFEEQDLSVVFKDLERWYDVPFQVMDEKINILKLTGVFPKYKELEHVLEIISLAAGVRCRLDEGNRVVRITENKQGGSYDTSLH